jgi:WD40 repeat protein
VSLPPTNDDVRIMGVAATESTVCLVDSIARIHLCDIDTRQVFSTRTFEEISNSVCLSVATDGHTFFVGAGNGFVVVVANNGVQKCSKRIHQNGVNAIACIQPGLMVSVSDDQSIAVWRFGDQVELLSHLVNASSCSIRAVAVLNNVIVTTGTDRRVTVYDFDGVSLGVRKKIPTAVTDPLAILIAENNCVVAGRGIESIRLL